MKTKEELNKLKEEVETMNKKLKELTKEELSQISGGTLNVEAEIWCRKNAAELLTRAKKKSAETLKSVQHILYSCTRSTYNYSLEQLKTWIGQEVYIDDLD